MLIITMLVIMITSYYLVKWEIEEKNEKERKKRMICCKRCQARKAKVEIHKEKNIIYISITK